MARGIGSRLWWCVAGMLVVACGDDEGSGDTSPFGSATEGTSSTGTPATSQASDTEPTSGATGSATSDATTPGDSSGTPTDDGSTAPPPPPATGTDSGDSGSSGGPGGAGLGECIGTGAWTNCTQYCTSVGDTCVEQGCDGNTVVYYDDVGACVAKTPDDFGMGACDDDFAMGGGISFARCCCV